MSNWNHLSLLPVLNSTYFAQLSSGFSNLSHRSNHARNRDLSRFWCFLAIFHCHHRLFRQLAPSLWNTSSILIPLSHHSLPRPSAAGCWLSDSCRLLHPLAKLKTFSSIIATCRSLATARGSRFIAEKLRRHENLNHMAALLQHRGASSRFFFLAFFLLLNRGTC